MNSNLLFISKYIFSKNSKYGIKKVLIITCNSHCFILILNSQNLFVAPRNVFLLKNT